MANWQLRWRKFRRRILPYWALAATLWALFVTAFPLHISYSDHKRELAKDRAAAREEVDEFMLDIRKNYATFCDQKSQALRKTHQSRYEGIARLASVETSSPPYDKPCRFLSVPGAPTDFSLTMAIKLSHNAPAFEDWQSFIEADEVTAVIWVADMPIRLDIDHADWSPIEPKFRALREQTEECTENARSQAEHAFMQIECQWHLNETNEIKLMRVEVRDAN